MRAAAASMTGILAAADEVTAAIAAVLSDCAQAHQAVSAQAAFFQETIERALPQFAVGGSCVTS